MKRDAGTATAPALPCAGTTRADATCRGYARYTCVCGRHWCGTHIARTGAGLRCPACGHIVAIA